MRTMQYRLPLEEYIISNGTGEDGDAKLAPIKLVRRYEWNPKYILEVDEDLQDIYEEALAGETDFVLTSISVSKSCMSIRFTSKSFCGTSFIVLDSSCFERLVFEVDRGEGNTPDIYKIVPFRRGESNGRITYSNVVTETHSLEKRVISFDNNGAYISEVHC